MGSTHQHPSEHPLQLCKSAQPASFLYYIFPKIMQILDPVRDHHNKAFKQLHKPFCSAKSGGVSEHRKKQASPKCFKGST